jgi:predicted transposase/invertase (TIGR01784 family)
VFEEKKPVLRLLNDFVCRNVFLDPDTVVDFISSVIQIPAEEFEEVTIEDPNILGEYGGDKSIILDVRVTTKSKHYIDVEIQLENHKAFVDRTIFNNARNLTAQMARGDKYDVLRRSISIIITNFNLFEDDMHQHKFMYYDIETKICLSDITELNYLELPKIPISDDGTGIYWWMRLFNAREEDEMEAIAKSRPELKKPVLKILKMSEDDKARRIADALWEQQIREDSRYDTGLEQGLEQGKAEGKAEGIAEGEAKGKAETARGMKVKGLNVCLIEEITGLTEEEIERL